MKLLKLSNILDENLDLFPKCSYRELFSEDFTMQFHRHQTVEVMIATNNSFEVDFFKPDDSNTAHTVTVSPNHLIIIDSNVFHRLSIRENNTKIINVEFDFFNKSLSTFPFDSQALYKTEKFNKFVSDNNEIYIIGCSKSLIRTIENIQQELLLFPPNMDRNNFTEEYFLNNFRLHYYTILFFHQIAKDYISLSKDTDETSHFVKKAISYINENISYENITPQKVAEHLHINQTYLSTVFSKQMSLTLSAYINHRKIALAMHLLASTTFPINQIAAQVGYNNRQHFIRQFKKLLGITPLEYRKSQKLEILNTHPNNDEIYPVEKIMSTPPRKNRKSLECNVI